MSINQAILELLEQLPSSEFFQNTHLAKLQINQEKLLTISDKDIQILGQSVKEKIQVDSQTTTLNQEKTVDFLSALRQHILRLDHLGVSYYAENIEEETNKYKKLLEGTDLKWYIENSGDSNQEWFFIGNKSVWEAPLVEVVLTRKNYKTYDAWIPHFQIDIDTTLGIEEIDALIEEYFGKNIIKWNLPIAGVGVVLTMIVPGEVNGTKIALGIGTKLRNTQFHRENILKEV